MEYPAEKVDLIREQVEEFLGIISQLIVPADTGEKIGQMVTELEGDSSRAAQDVTCAFGISRSVAPSDGSAVAMLWSPNAPRTRAAHPACRNTLLNPREHLASARN